MEKPRIKSGQWWILRIVVFLLSCWFIWFHISDQVNHLGAAKQSLADLLESGRAERTIFFLLLLSLLNWSLEAIKWMLLVRPLEAAGFIRSLRAFFNGITLSFFTPNRVGEFAGRIIYLAPENRVKGALLTFIGSTAQLLVTIQAGIIAFLALLPLFFELDANTSLLWKVLLCLVLLLLTLGWFRLPRIVRWIDRLNIRTSWKEKAHVWDECSASELLQVWLLSLLRYAVFTVQFVIIFGMLGFGPGFFLLSGLVAISYILITVIPSIALGELGVRGSVNLAVFGLAGADPSTILLATFMLWTMNLALPALLGAVSVLFIKIRRKVSVPEE